MRPIEAPIPISTAKNQYLELAASDYPTIQRTVYVCLTLSTVLNKLPRLIVEVHERSWGSYSISTTMRDLATLTCPEGP